MNFYSEPTHNLSGEVQVPGDKSISHRAALLCSIARGRSQINGCLLGADNYATINAMQQMGVGIQTIDDENIVIIDGVGLHGLHAPSGSLNLGNSGTGLRLLTGLLSAQSFDSVLTGDKSLSRRPMARIVNPLHAMGAKITMAHNKTPPLNIAGGQFLHGIDYTLPVASAQVKACLLLAGIYANGATCITEPAPTRDHLERLLQTLGYPLQINDNTICLTGGGELHAADIDIPADMSSAAFFMVAALITPGSSLVLKQVGINLTRVGVIHILKAMGADIEIINQRDLGHESVGDIHVRYSELSGIDIPFKQIPLAIDEFPVLFIAAACAKGSTTLRGARELRVKESDRIAVMAMGLRALGVKTETLEDGIIIDGGELQGGVIDSHGDHRVAMAFAIAGCVAKSPIIIKNCENVATSFPNFVELGSEVGMSIRYLEA